MPYKVEIRLNNVGRYLNLLCLYKANLAAVLAAGIQLTEVADVDYFIEIYNGWVEKLVKEKQLAKEKGKSLLLQPEDFQACGVPLSSSLSCMVEARESARNFASPFKELRGMFCMANAFNKMIKLADATLKVKTGTGRKSYIFAAVDALDALGSSGTMKINRDFHKIVRNRVLNFTQLYVLAASLTAIYGSAEAKLFMQAGKFYSSIAVNGGALPRRYAEFYVELVKANSRYAEAAASSLLTYINTGDPAKLYEIVRNMTYAMNRKKLKSGEAEALRVLLEHEAGGRESS